jgi:hypothetical protein
VPPAAAIVERRALGVQIAQPRVEALADYLAVANQHRTDQRVWADSPATSLGELEGPSQMGSVRLCELGGHATD